MSARWGAAIVLCTLASASCLFGLLFAVFPDPPRGEGERDGLPFALLFSAASLALLAGAALVVFLDEDRRSDWRAGVLAFVLALVGWPALLRLLWLWFVALGGQLP